MSPSSEEIKLIAYGQYLYHGGTPEGFAGMTPDDVQLIYLMYAEERSRIPRMLSKGE